MFFPTHASSYGTRDTEEPRDRHRPLVFFFSTPRGTEGTSGPHPVKPSEILSLTQNFLRIIIKGRGETNPDNLEATAEADIAYRLIDCPMVIDVIDTFLLCHYLLFFFITAENAGLTLLLPTRESWE